MSMGMAGATPPGHADACSVNHRPSARRRRRGCRRGELPGDAAERAMNDLRASAVPIDDATFAAATTIPTSAPGAVGTGEAIAPALPPGSPRSPSVRFGCEAIRSRFTLEAETSCRPSEAPSQEGGGRPRERSRWRRGPGHRRSAARVRRASTVTDPRNPQKSSFGSRPSRRQCRYACAESSTISARLYASRRLGPVAARPWFAISTIRVSGCFL